MFLPTEQVWQQVCTSPTHPVFPTESTYLINSMATTLQSVCVSSKLILNENKGQQEQNKPPSARTRHSQQRPLPMSSKSIQGKKKTPPTASSANKSSKKNKKDAASPSSAASLGGASSVGLTSKSARPRNFNKIEDQLLCRAYVNNTTILVLEHTKRRRHFGSE
jgi:hypothetical protein